MARLGDVCTLRQGFQIPIENQVQEVRDGYVRFIRIVDYTQHTDDIRYVKDCSKFYYVKADDIVMIRYGAAGEVGFGIEGVIANNLFLIEPNIEINKKYLIHYLKQPRVKSELLAASSSTTMPAINFKTVRELNIPEHTLTEQHDIVCHLDKIDSLILLRNEQLAKLDELVKSRFIEMFGDPIRNEKGWPIVTLGEVAEIRIGPFGSLLHKEDYIVGGHALVNPSHIIDGNICTDDKLTVSDEKYEELSAYRLSIGDLVLGRRGEMGRCAVVYEDGLLCGTGSIIIRPKEKMKPYFLQNIISSPGYKRIIEDKAVGVTMMNLNVPIVSSLTIPLLPIDMQEQYIAFMQQTDKSKFEIQQSLVKIETLKKALMQKYFG